MQALVPCAWACCSQLALAWGPGEFKWGLQEILHGDSKTRVKESNWSFAGQLFAATSASTGGLSLPMDMHLHDSTQKSPRHPSTSVVLALSIVLLALIAHAAGSRLTTSPVSI